MSFADLGLSEDVLKAITEKGYETPTPIQEKAIPYVLMGRDVLGCAQTGTGKTASFTLPMITILSSGKGKALMPRSLILEPTRELAAQVAENFRDYGKHGKLSMALLIGGESVVEQEKILARGVDVLIATPGRLLDMFERGRILLTDTKLLVIDEADRMMDMGFMPDVERIVGLLPKMRQTLFFSATMAPEIKRLADKFLMNPKEISVAPPASTATTVTQGLAIVDVRAKREALRHLIDGEEVSTAIIFCNRKRDIGVLKRSLERHGYNAGELHGDMAQSKRSETLDRFKAGEITLLVASDVAARGIDVSNLSHVFNFDVPTHAEDYVHRIGRTGRAGRDGKAYTLATKAETKYVKEIEKLIGKPIPLLEIPGVEPAEAKEPTETSESAKPTSSRSRSRRSSQSEEQSDRAQRTERTERSARDERSDRRGRRGGRRGSWQDGDQDVGEANTTGGPIVGLGDHVPAFLLRPAPIASFASSRDEAA
ncbi:MAG: DEAD/DEAH box helicase [Pseudomonadota bacterium]